MNSREKFENWAKRNEYVIGDAHWLAREGDGYYNATLQLMWEAWQACEAQFVVELPRSIPILTRDEVVKAIEAAGGRCK